MKITAITQQVKTPGRYSIFIDGKFGFGLSELGLINFALKTGQELSEKELETLKSDAAADKIYNMTLSLIARRPRSEGEIEDYLRRKKIEEAVQKTILNKLSVKGFVDDREFAHRWVENRRLLKPISSKKLIMELRQKRIADEIIQEVLSRDEADERTVLKELIEKKRSQTRYSDKTKLMAYLARQGFRYDDIKSVLQDFDS